MDNQIDIAKYIDHTLLKPDATTADIQRLCEEALRHNFATVCVNSANIPQCRQLLTGSSVRLCTVVGFPLGASMSASKAIETTLALDDGAEEIDMVLNIGFLKSKDYRQVHEDIKSVRDAIANFNPYINRPIPLLKVIIETCLLTDEEKKKACEIAVEAGADFVKTSTGFSTGGATVEDVRLMKSVVGDRAKVKASGGIRDRATALAMIEAGADRLGTSAGVAIVSGGDSIKSNY